MLQNIISIPFKTILKKNITFKLNKKNFLITFSPKKSKNNTITHLPTINLNNYTLITNLKYPNFTHTTLTFKNLTISYQIHKKIHLSTNNHTISNYQNFKKPIK